MVVLKDLSLDLATLDIVFGPSDRPVSIGPFWADKMY